MTEIWEWDTVNDNNSPTEGTMPAGLVSDYFREIKGASAREQKGTYPVTATTGTATAYVLADDRSISTGYIDGMIVGCRLHVANGDNPTLNVNTQGAKKILHNDGSDVLANQLGGVMQMSYYAAADGGNGAFAILAGEKAGTASHANIGTGVGDVVALVDVNGTPGFPAVDGSQLTGLVPTWTGQTLRGQLGPVANHPKATAGIWIDCTGTIGNPNSAATYASADAQTLFEHLWTNCADAQCPVSGGRGASANADWTADKRLTLPDYVGKAGVQIGGAAAGVIGSQVPDQANADVRGGVFGASTHQLTAGENGPHFHYLAAQDNSNTPIAENLQIPVLNDNNPTDQRRQYELRGSVGGANVGRSSVAGSGTAHNVTQASIAEDVWIAL